MWLLTQLTHGSSHALLKRSSIDYYMHHIELDQLIFVIEEKIEKISVDGH